MSLGNQIVAALLRSRAHALLSGRVALVRYRGRRSGRWIETPVQYVELDDGIVVLVGRPDSKRWWRNFSTGADLDVLVQGVWRSLYARVVRERDEPALAARLLDAYVARFPSSRRSLPAAGDSSVGDAGAVLVWGTPR